MNSRKCEVFIIDVHRASYVKHLRSKKHFEKEKISNMNIPQWLVQEPIEIKNKKVNNPKSLKQIARDNTKLDDKQIKKNYL